MGRGAAEGPGGPRACPADEAWRTLPARPPNRRTPRSGRGKTRAAAAARERRLDRAYAALFGRYAELSGRAAPRARHVGDHAVRPALVPHALQPTAIPRAGHRPHDRQLAVTTINRWRHEPGRGCGRR